jgi:uncharacterized Zn-finger protein
MSALPAHPAPSTEIVTRTRIACDGGEGALGHPRVWMMIPPEDGWVDCGYCDKRFILDGSEAAKAARKGSETAPGKAAE